MTGLAILLGGAALALGVARWSGLPSIPLLLLAGLGLALPGLLPRELLQDAVVLGVTFLVFTAGIELDLDRVGAPRRAALRIGIAQFLLLGAAGYGVSLLLGFGTRPSLYLALALAASSTLVVVRLLQRRRQMFEPFGRMVLGVLLVQDVAVILLVPALAGIGAGAAVALRGLVGVALLGGIAWTLHRGVVPFVVHRMELDEEAVLVAVLALLFVLSALAEALELPWFAGAFAAGVALAGFPVSGLVRGQLRPLSDFFVAILFISLGGLLVIPSPRVLAGGLALAATVVVLTPPLVTVLAERAGLSARNALEGGLLLSQTSEFSLVVGIHGLLLGHIGADLFTVLTLVTASTMMLTPFLATDRVTWWLMRFHPHRRRGGPAAPPSGHVLFLGCGEHTMALLETVVAVGHAVVVVDDDPAVIDRLARAGVRAVRGDASDPEVLERAGADRARIIVSTVRRVADNETALRMADGVPVVVRVFDPADAGWVRRLGGTPVLYAEAAAEDFLEWFDGAGVA